MSRRPCTTRSQSSTIAGPVNWITSATLIAIRSIARKYESCTIATPARPSQAIRGTSARAIRSRRRSTSASAPASSTNDTVTRSWLRCEADTPSSSSSFAMSR